MHSGAADDRTDQHSDPTRRPEFAPEDRTTATAIGFIAEASHALRNPLHGVLGLSEMLIEANLGGALADAAWAIFRQAAQMRSVVDDMVDLARIEAGHLRVRLTSVDLRHALNDSLYLARDAAPDGIQVSATRVPADAALVQGDHDRIRQALGNLLDNACIAAVHRVDVTVALASDERTVRITVTDDGPGFEPDDLPRLFLPYERGPQADPARPGLGLTIAKGSVEAMGGRIGATVSPATGTSFWIELPATPARVDEPSPSAGLRDHGRPHVGLRVLVVEDDPVNRMLASMQLERLGAEVTATPTGEDAWEVLQDETFDVAFVDVQMPGISGLELVRRMSHMARQRPITAIMTASATAADRVAALAAGADHFLAKPATLVDIRAILDTHPQRSLALPRR